MGSHVVTEQTIWRKIFLTIRAFQSSFFRNFDLSLTMIKKFSFGSEQTATIWTCRTTKIGLVGNNTGAGASVVLQLLTQLIPGVPAPLASFVDIPAVQFYLVRPAEHCHVETTRHNPYIMEYDWLLGICWAVFMFSAFGFSVFVLKQNHGAWQFFDAL